MAVVLKDVCGYGGGCLSKTSPQFQAKLVQVAQRLGMDPNWLAASIAFESGFNPKAVNSISGATGLIQFMPRGSIPDLGTTQAELLAMSDVDQLDYVEAYFKKYQPNRKYRSVQDVYFAIFLPVLIGKSLDDVAASAGSENAQTRKIYEQNYQAFDKSGKGYFTAREVAAPILSILAAAEKKTGVTVSDAVAVAAVGAAVWVGVIAGGYLAWRKRRKAAGKKVPL